jgi:rare lipoprotein A (peptidoglycan hydrolase)
MAAPLPALAAALASLGAAPAADAASTPGSSASGGAAPTVLSPGLPSAPGSSTPGTSASNPLVQPGDVPVSASGAGITISTTASALLRNQLQFSGTVPAAAASRTVELERLGHETHWTWQPTVAATVTPQGQFTATWATNHIGQFQFRVVTGTASGQVATDSASASPTVTATVYRPSIATWYGPGFFGSQTACGEKLTKSTLGLANRTLPCGTEVALYYGGKTLTVPVIDRGPYANHADWDLTQATSQALGITDTVKLGAVSLPKRS